MTRPDRVTAPTAIAFCAVAVGALSLIPVCYLFLTGVSLTSIRDELGYDTTVAAIVQTVVLTVLISVIAVVLGVGCAVLVSRTSLPFPRLFTVLFALPLAVPGFVSSYAVYAAELSYAPRAGVVTSLGGASVVMALTLSPYVFLPCVVALRHVDPAQEEAVASLRRHRLSPWWHVTLPALRPAIAAGVLIVALHVLAEYGAMAQLGRSTLTTKIMAEMLDYGDYQAARSLSLVLLVLSVLVLGVTRVLSGSGHATDVTRGAARTARRASLGRWTVPTTVLALAIPVLALGPTVLMTLRGLTNEARTASLDWNRLGPALSTTLGYAVAAAAVATILALPVAWWVTRRPSSASQLAERSVWVAHAIPSAILALALVYLATRLAPSLYKTPAVLIAAYVILFLPLAVANQRVGLGTSRQAYDDVAASLGSRPARTFARITLPLAAPGVVTGAILVGLDASKELTSTLMLLPFNTHTLSSELWATTNGEALDFTAAAPYAALLVLLGALPVFLLVRHTLRQLPASAPPSTRAASGKAAGFGPE